jgi:purine-binding chemotaxis protein CheW
MVMEIAGGLVGFVVDAVSEVLRVHADEIQPPPVLISGNTFQEFLSGVYHHNQRLLIVMNVASMFTEHEQQSFSDFNKTI